MEKIIEFIRPELMVLAVAAYVIGMFLKNGNLVLDKYIPLILTAFCGITALVYVFATADIATSQNVLMAVFTGVTQGVLCTGAAVLVNQILKQSKKNN